MIYYLKAHSKYLSENFSDIPLQNLPILLNFSQCSRVSPLLAFASNAASAGGKDTLASGEGSAGGWERAAPLDDGYMVPFCNENESPI